jgi:hypothetical protein
MAPVFVSNEEKCRAISKCMAQPGLPTPQWLLLENLRAALHALLSEDVMEQDDPK